MTGAASETARPKRALDTMGEVALEHTEVEAMTDEGQQQQRQQPPKSPTRSQSSLRSCSRSCSPSPTRLSSTTTTDTASSHAPSLPLAHDPIKVTRPPAHTIASSSSSNSDNLQPSLPFVAPSHYLRQRSTEHANVAGGVRTQSITQQHKHQQQHQTDQSRHQFNRPGHIYSAVRAKDTPMSPLDQEQLEGLVSGYDE